MQIPKETIEKFIKIWKKEFGEDISEDYAAERFRALVNSLRVITKVPSKVVKEEGKCASCGNSSPSPNPNRKKKWPKLF